jgi:hypothetical protein
LTLSAARKLLLYEASRLVVEESVSERREHSARRLEASDVVVGVEIAIGGAGKRSRGGHDG